MTASKLHPPLAAGAAYEGHVEFGEVTWSLQCYDGRHSECPGVLAVEWGPDRACQHVPGAVPPGEGKVTHADGSCETTQCHSGRHSQCPGTVPPAAGTGLWRCEHPGCPVPAPAARMPQAQAGTASWPPPLSR